MDINRYLELINLSEQRANDRLRKIKITKNMQTRCNKFVVTVNPKRRKMWTSPPTLNLSPLVMGNSKRPMRF